MTVLRNAKRRKALAANLTADQARFLDLHMRHVVTKWQWYMQGAQLRAYTECGRVATIQADALGELVDAGIVKPIGSAGVRLTEAGRMAICA